MSLKVYNVLNRKKEEFVPEKANEVKMYACGITVSDNAHIGHAYQAVVFDMIYRYLNYLGYHVKYVRNYTDIDDKIIIQAKEKNVDPLEYAEKLIKKTDAELAKLEIKEPMILARATHCIDTMIDFIQKLIVKGFAYSTEKGDVYFRIKSFMKYGSFSNRINGDEIAGVRKEIEIGKENEKDFALWKKSKDDEIGWDSPWGKGRPGWHIECSAMILKYLGETIDIHGGGEDLLFPHHENEIAQTEALTGKQLAKYWLHNGLVNINGQKMSKSLGNSILLEELLKKYDSDVIRLTLLQNNYRSHLNIIDGMFEKNEEKIYNFYKIFMEGNDLVEIKDEDFSNRLNNEFKAAMNNDFNTAVALANLFNYMQELEQLIINKDQRTKSRILAIKETYNVLGILQKDPKVVLANIRAKHLQKNKINEAQIKAAIEERQAKKVAKDYQEADKIRAKLSLKGIILQDDKDGTKWDIRF